MTKKTTEEFITEAKQVHDDFYDYSKVVYKSNKRKVTIKCPLHGNFDQNAKSHLKGSGCPKCSVEKRKSRPIGKRRPQITQEFFVEQAKKIHNDFYNYSKVICKNSYQGVTITCPLHGDFVQKPVNHLKGFGCPYCSGTKITNKSFIEKAVQEHGNKYDYSKVSVVNGNETVEIICPVHGSFWQSPEKHCYGRGCPSCAPNRTLDTDGFIKQSIIKHGKRYDYSKVQYNGSTSKVEIICPEHGSFWQPPDAHIQGRGCSKCGRSIVAKLMSKTTEDFIKDSKLAHEGKYEYSMVDYVNNRTKVEIICPVHGSFWQSPSSHRKGIGCPTCSNFGPSKGEQEIKGFIESDLGLTISTSDRSVIPPYEIDIYIPDHNLAIEFNGLYWHSTAVKKDRKYHLRKTEMCEEQGIRLIHIYEDEWLNKRNRIKDILRSMLCPTTIKKYNARNCTVDTIDPKTARMFLNVNHIQGYASSSIKIGLFYDGTLVAYMGFIKISDSSYNLNRFCTSGLVRGGFSKLLKHAIRNYSVSHIISYADRRWSQGGVYEKCGFIKTNTSNPSFDYINHNIRYNRQQFMKKYLSKKFPNTYDPSLTEWENMELQGYYQIWNCGYIKYEFHV